MRITCTHRGKSVCYELEGQDTVVDLKIRLEKEFNIPFDNQKLVYRGILKEGTLLENNIQSGSKIMVLGVRNEEIIKLNLDSAAAALRDFSDTTSVDEKLQDMPKHKRIIDMGPPEGAIQGTSEVLPLPVSSELTHLRDQFGNKARVAFLSGYMRINTNTGTNTFPLSHVLDSKFEEIIDKSGNGTGYSIMHLSTKGEHCSKNLFIYFVPDQYTRALKAIFSFASIM